MPPSLRWLLIVPALLQAAGAAARPPAADTDAYLEREMQLQSIPGLALAVLRHGNLIYAKGYGAATLEHPVPVKPDTVFQLGSLGKQFTATAVMRLAAAGLIGLDQSIVEYLPELPASWKPITVRHVLAHQAGIAQLDGPDLNRLDLRHEYTDEEYIALAAAQPLEFPAGSDAAYSDTGYVLLGILLNRVTHGSYGTYLDAHLFQPLGMSRTRIISDADIIPDRASGYEINAAGALQNQSFVSAYLNATADGSLYSTVIDLSHWDAALLGDGVLPEALMRQMWTVPPLKDGTRPLYHYGYGWEINDLRGHTVIEYDGHWQGFQTAMARYDDGALTVILLTNRALSRTQRLAHTVAGLFDAALRHYEVAAHDPDQHRTLDVRALIDEVITGTVHKRRFTPTGRRQVSATWLRSLARELRTVGPVKSIEFCEERASKDHTDRTYRVRTAAIDEFLTVRYSRDDRIDGIDLYREY